MRAFKVISHQHQKQNIYSNDSKSTKHGFEVGLYGTYYSKMLRFDREFLTKHPASTKIQQIYANPFVLMISKIDIYYKPPFLLAKK